MDDEIRVLFPNGLRSGAAAAASAPSGDASAKTKAPYRPKSPPALEGTATPPVTGAGAGVRRRPAAGADPRINMMPESDYDYDREYGELEIENIEREVEDHAERDRAAAAAASTARPATARPATARPTATSLGEYDYQIDDSESDESSTSATPFGPHAAIKAVRACCTRIVIRVSRIFALIIAC